MNGSLSAERRRKTILSVVLAFICILYILPVLAVVVNSFKLNTYVKTETFALPTAESFAGWANYIKGVTFGNYPFWKSAFYSLFITLVSTVPRWPRGTSPAWTASSAAASITSASFPWSCRSRWSCSLSPRPPTA